MVFQTGHDAFLFSPNAESSAAGVSRTAHEACPGGLRQMDFEGPFGMQLPGQFKTAVHLRAPLGLGPWIQRGIPLRNEMRVECSEGPGHRSRADSVLESLFLQDPGLGLGLFLSERYADKLSG